jgi:hypothetical protein
MAINPAAGAARGAAPEVIEALRSPPRLQRGNGKLALQPSTWR